MVMTTMVMIIPPPSPVAARGIPRSTRCSRNDHADDGRHGGVLAPGSELERRLAIRYFTDNNALNRV